MRTCRRMDRPNVLGFTLFIATLLQFSSCQNDLRITSVTSPTSATLSINWTSTSTAVAYFLLDLRVINSSAIPPVSVYTTLSTRSRVIQGLRAGTHYNVTLKSFLASSAELASTWHQALTVPATPQIIQSNGISSTQITIGWSPQTGTNYYFLIVSLGLETINRTYSGLSGNVIGLKPATVYSLTLYAVNTAGFSTASRKITALTLTPPPTNIVITTISSYSAALTWQAVDKALMYGIYIYENADLSSSPIIRKTTALTVMLDNLLPCTKYIFGFTTFNWFYAAGEENRVSYHTGKIDSVVGLFLDYKGNSAPALVSWAATRGATSYTAMADSTTGSFVTCTSSDTSCQLEDLLCETRYHFTVVAKTDNCASDINSTITLDTAPCAPENITVTHDCLVNIIYFTWNPVVDAIGYTVNALAPDGSKEYCSNRDTSCFFMNLMCGTEYSITVYGFDGLRNGSSSLPITVRTTPCDPQDVQAISDCVDGTLTISWTQSAGAFSYAAMALGSSGTIYNCTSFSTSCVITDLQCGESLSVSAVAYDDECSSSKSISDEVVAAPCTPTNIVVLKVCETDQVMVQWDFTVGAVVYMVDAKGSDGSHQSCTTADLSCMLTNLSCGKEISISVIATNYICNSTASAVQLFHTVPCTPNYIRNELNCNHNIIMVTWQEGVGNLTYAAIAQDEDGTEVPCLTDNNYCEIRDINCGAIYTVSVSASDGACHSATNQTLPFHSVPCIPTNVQAMPDCINGTVAVSWTLSHGVGVELYVATLESNNQPAGSCSSVENHCVISSYPCGVPLTVYVVAIGIDCQSMNSQEVYIEPVPCVPQNVTVNLECGTSTALLSWESSLGAAEYLSTVTGYGGVLHYCNSMNTTCSMSDLQCGQAYELTVSAAHGLCSSATSPALAFQTAPCTPESVVITVLDAGNTTMLTWTASPGVLQYFASVTGPAGVVRTCNSTATTCTIVGLECGQVFSASVTAYDSTCHSPESVPQVFQTVPCIPAHLQAATVSATGVVQLSWNSAPGAVTYVSNVTGPHGEVLSCNTTATTCNISGLVCGLTYQATISAFGDTQSSGPSAPVEFQTAPCPPQTLGVNIDCVTNMATLSWEATLGAESYQSTLTGPGGEQPACNSSDTSCSTAGLPCGQTYNATIYAVNDQSSSLPGSTITFQTAPCTPATVLANIDCASNTAILSWASVPGAEAYSSTVTSADGEMHTCNTTQTGCPVSGLSCGKIYYVIIIASNPTCQSAASSVAELQSVPCSSANVVTLLDLPSNDAALMWDSAPGAVSYISYLTGAGGEEYSCLTANTSCSVGGMQCGQRYNVTVLALNGACSSLFQSPEALETAPCAPSNVVAIVDCTTKNAEVLWDAAAGALSYTATASGPGGTMHTCNTSSLTCDLSGLLCGRNYSVSVTAVGSSYTGPPSNTVQLQNVPCSPGNVQTLLDCDTNTATMQWAPASGAVSYLSTVTSPDGDTRTCNTTANNCEIDSLQCGSTYTATITAKNGHCDNAVSAPVQLTTAPCIPGSVESLLNCTAETATLIWPITLGAVNYSSLVTGPSLETLDCSTSDTTCYIEGLQCGQDYNITLKAHGQQCTSPGSASAALQTAPCAPQNLGVVLDCGTGTAALSWGAAPGALSYVSNVRGPDGEELSCNTTGTTCSIHGLECGQQYNASVTAFNDLCSGVSSATQQFQTAPCTPNDLNTQVDCSTNVATLSWAAAPGAESYFASVTAPGEALYSCNTTTYTCEISNLKCGLTYTGTVTASSELCTSAVSAESTFQTAPCAPEDVNSVVDCASNIATLSWADAPGAVNYTSTLNSSAGDHQSCNTTTVTCDISTLQCGQKYSATISAHSGMCSSAPSNMITFWTVPCIPSFLDTSVGCSDNIAILSWETTDGALSYTSTVTGPNGQEHSCNATLTSCSTSALECGQTYNVTLEALGVECSSVASTVPELHTAPCQPDNLEMQLDCGSNTATLSWNAAAGALSYSSSVIGPTGDEYICNSSTTTCTFQGLGCGLEYRANVTAYNNLCSGITSTVKLFQTAPCIPQNVEAAVDCETSIVRVSWEPALGALSYVSNVTGPYGESASCSSVGTSCEIDGLQCGQIYNFTVTAIGETCSLSPSIAVSLQTAPCTASQVVTLIDCDTNTATVSWQAAEGAVNYTSTLSRQGEGPHSCYTMGTTCDVSGLQCGQTYNVTVTAFSEECRGFPSMAVELHTAPCVPMDVATLIDCASNNAVLLWLHADGALNYVSSMTDLSGSVADNCNTTENTCSFFNLNCGQTYNVTVTAFGETCSSGPSAAATLVSAPCIPIIADTHLDCATNTMELSLNVTPGALSYQTTVGSAGGELMSLNTTETNYVITNLACGQTYNTTISAINDLCSSHATPFQFHTAPCSPLYLESQLDGTSNILTLSWENAFGAVSYTTNVTRPGGEHHSCTTTNNNCSISDMVCGEDYTATVKAVDTTCSSPESNEIAFQTVPCTPTTVEAHLDPASSNATLSWGAASGALYYTASVFGPMGEVHSCNTSDTTCTIIDLECGQTYQVTVTAHSKEYISNTSVAVQLLTAPCIPGNFSTDIDCSTNTATLAWSPAAGAENYTSTVTGPDGVLHSCSTGASTCSIGNLQCGQTYTAAVTATRGGYSSAASLPAAIETAPCIPAAPAYGLDCATNTASLHWGLTEGAESFTVMATERDGHTASCNTTGAACDIAGLLCGTVYDVAVTAEYPGCQALPSASVQIATAPCPPENVIPFVDLTNTLSVTWEASGRVALYTVIAEGSNGIQYSCNSSDTSCTLPFLDCETVFNVTVVEQSNNCSSPHSQAVSVQTGICQSSVINSSLDCNNNSASFWWNEQFRATNYSVLVNGANGMKSCDSADLSCAVADLACGQLLNVTWTAYDADFGVVETVNTKIESAPCPPTNLMHEMTCATNSATVWWSHVGDVMSYSVIATAINGHQVSCNSTSTTCNLRNLQCDQTYTVTVTATSVHCQVTSAASIFLDTAPCAPTNVLGHVDCTSNNVTVSWDRNDRATSYQALIRDLSGGLVTCNTTDTRCDISTLTCGRRYTVTVTALQGDCASNASNSVEIETAPCAPDYVGSIDSCGSDVVIYWDASDGAISYTVTATQSNGNLTSCRSAITSCHLSDLPCGESFQATVRASSHTCDSSLSSIIEFHTVPCTPQSFDGIYECNSDSASLFWASTPGAIQYTASVVASNGNSTTCTSANTTCDVSGLRCGQNYTIHVSAANQNCSAASDGFNEIMTAPCPPHGLTVHYDCERNTAEATWRQSYGATVYAVTALGSNDRVVRCNSSALACNLVGFACGQNYSITVRARNSQCDSLPSLEYKLETVPCAPSDVQSSLQYDSHAISVTWAASSGADGYTATASIDEHVASCTTSGTTCDIPGLFCSKQYLIAVTGSSGICNSSDSVSTLQKTIPCAPPQLAAFGHYDSNSATVSWAPTGNAESYTATAVGVVNASCHTANITCVISGLQCGQLYTVSVAAYDGSGYGLVSPGVDIRTAPCSPLNVQSTVICDTNALLVTWDESDGATSYIATAVGTSGQVLQITTNNTHCDIRGLQCGESYNVTVVGTYQDYQSPLSETVTSRAVPCTPDHLHADVQCENSTILVTWSTISGAASYIATALGKDGVPVLCNTTDSHCTLAGLACGNNYSITVRASDGACESIESSTTYFNTVPCRPQIVSADYVLQTASVFWQPCDGATSYTATVEGSNGDIATCITTATFCDIPNILCGQVYVAHVTAKNEMCNIRSNYTKEIITAPCSPQNVSAIWIGNGFVAQVTWDPSDGALSYVVTAEGSTDAGHYSCQTVDTVCEIGNMSCGNKYTFSVTAVGAKSNTSSDYVFSMQSAPCPPENFVASVSGDSNQVSASWEASLGATYYTVLTEGPGGGSNISCNTTSTSCQFSGLSCGMPYILWAIAGSGPSQSSPSNTILIKTAPCEPQFVNALLHCDMNIASITWESSAGATSYIAFATANDVNTQSCNSTDTFCDIVGLDCGEVYNITVTAFDDVYSSTPSSPAELATAPCFPLNVQTHMACDTGTISVSWGQARGAEHYKAVASGLDGHRDICNTTATQCDIGDLHCGVYYSISVIAENLQCNNTVVSTGLLQTAPCVPEYVVGEFECSTNTALVAWSESSSGASYYMVTAENEFGTVGSCTTPLSSCQIPGLQCGHAYTFTAQAGNGQCNASLITSNETRSAPCPPGHVAAVLDCATNNAYVSWLPSEGAQMYSAIATANGNSSTCNTLSTNCTFYDLQCGTQYSVTVEAVDDKCHSVPASASVFQTAPCVPTIIDTSVDCENNSVFVVWHHSDGAQLYEVTVEGNGGNVFSYATLNTSSLFPELSCGESFGILVKAIDGVCNSSQSDVFSIQTAPCPPDITEALTDCARGITSLAWNQSVGADTYLLTATAENGHIVLYETTELQYNVSDLSCGMLYTITVAAVSLQCNSSHSSAAQVQAVPCVPTTLQATFDCSQGVVEVSWEESYGALAYTVNAHGSVGYPSGCSTSNTTCTIPDLACGHTYDITISSDNNVCSSRESGPVSVTTASCPLNKVDTRVDCSTNDGLASWEIIDGALFYEVTSVSINGDTEFHRTTDTNCTLISLQCGLTYNVTTLAVDGICNDTRAVTELKTVPCMPGSVMAVSECSTGTVTVTWSPSAGARSYIAIAKAPDGNIGSCNTTSTSCDIRNLLCDHVYYITVTGLDENCQGHESETFEIQTVPCTPTNITTRMECYPSTLSVSWGPAETSVAYLVQALGSNGFNYNCTTNTTDCDLQDLACGQSYAVTVTAVYDECTSDRSPTILVKSVPCVPQNVHFALDCETNLASVEWESSPGATEYQVTAISTDAPQSACNSTDTICVLSNLQCGLTYNVEVVAQDDRCTSNFSSPLSLETVPCVPENSQVEMDCMNNSAVFTWDLSRGGQSYFASVTGEHGYARTCDTAGMQCPASDLVCGANYLFAVTASNGICNSSSTDALLVGLVPCPPVDVVTSLYHPAIKPQEVEVSWGESHCGVDYMATVQGGIEDNPEALFILNSYWTNYPDFYIATPCSSAYNVTVTARNAAGLSAPSVPIGGVTAPCPPVVNTPTLNGDHMVISWQASLYAVEYMVKDASSGNVLCQTDSLSCQVPVTSATLEVTAVSPSGESDPVTVSGLGSSK
ncbi:serine-rich adhesin for platelets-like [Ambystoma mexicanum]|uniref:serine-rich adhesin for platelets-like n=1 Tax=Ambystoma mexicanum TaxID=8296 RepID=UPI0037E8D31C